MQEKSAIGTRQTSVHLNGEVTAVDFGHDYKYYAVRNDGTASIYVSTENSECTVGANGVVCVPAGGGYTHYNGYGGSKKIYLSGNGAVTVIAQDDASCPFKSAPVSGGGEGGDADTVNGHTVEADVPADAVFTDTTYDAATLTEDGLMSAADKTKLNGIEEGANKTIVDTAINGLSTNPVSNKAVEAALRGKAANSHLHDTRYYTRTVMDAKLDEKAGKDVATQSADGLMSAEDKVKLDNVTASGGLSVELIATSSSLSSNGTLLMGYTKDLECYDAIYVNFQYGTSALVSCFILVSDLSKKISFTTNNNVSTVAPNTHDLSYFHFYGNGSSANGVRQIGIKNNGSSTAFVNVRAYGITGISGLT